jgi:hypothetical protein
VAEGTVAVYAAKIIADRPVNVRTIERYMLAGDLPGLKLSNEPKADLRLKQIWVLEHAIGN